MKAKSVIEVIVVFSLTLLLVALAGLSPLGRWERQLTSRNFIEYAVMIAFPLLILLVTRRDLSAYGLSLHNLPYHLSVAGTALVPVAISSVAIAFLPDYREWNGALILAAVEIAVLFAVAWMLRRKPTQRASSVPVGAILLLLFPGLAQKTFLDGPFPGFLYYLFFVGLGEELLFRGYIQSRLNAAWGRPFEFYGVNWGWGLVITSLLFGLMHVLNTGSLIAGSWQLTPWWGFWTFFAGLVTGFVREKTGSITAPAILHGLPQALGAAFGLV